MPEKYQLVLGIENNQADAAARASLKLMQQYERQCLAAAKAAQAAFQTAGAAVGGPGGGSAVMPAAVAARMRGVSAVPSQATLKAAEPKIDVGYYKAALEGIKLQDRKVAAAEKAAIQVSAIEDKYYVKDYQSRVKAEQKKQAIDDLARSRTQKAIKDLEGLEESYRVRDYKARVAQEKRKEALERGPAANAAKYRRKALDDEQAHAVAINRITDVQNKRKIEGIAKVMGEQRLSFAEAVHSALGLEQAFGKVGIAMAGLAAGKSIILGLAGAFIEARKNAEGFGKTTADFMISLRPLASVMGGKPDFAFAQKVARFGIETAMPKAEAATFLESFAGRAQITKGKQISEPEYEKFTTLAGKMTTARGIPADIAGDLFASVLKIEDFKKKSQGAREAVTRAGALFDILDAGSGRIKELAPQAQQLMASLASENELEGVFRNAAEVGVMTSLMAENIPGEAAVFGRSTIKALSRFEDKDRQPFYRRAGIKPGMPALQRIELANKVFEEEVAKGRPLESVLEGFGLAADVREKTGLMTAFKARKTVLAPQLERMKGFEGPGAAEKVQQQVEERFKDIDVQTSKARAENEAADLKTEALTANIYRERASAQLKREGYMDKPLKMLSLVPGRIASLNMRTSLETAIEGRAIAMAQKDAGVTPGVSLGEAVWGDTDATINALIEKTRQKRLAESALPSGKLGPAKARGEGWVSFADIRSGAALDPFPGPGKGNPAAALPDLKPGMERLAKAIEDNNLLLQGKKPAKPAVAAPPAQPVAGPAQLSGR